MGQELLTPVMRRLLGRMARARGRALHEMTPTEARAAYEAGAEVLDLPRAALPVVADFALPGGDGGARRARYYAGGVEARPLLLYLHGGGFVVGSLETHDSLCRQLALRSGWAVVALDYRLAPEHPFPAAVDDAWAATRALAGWLRGGDAPVDAEHAAVDAGGPGGPDADVAATGRRGAARRDRPWPLAVAGDSAGGTLAAVVALMARDAGLPLALQILITPGTAAEPDSASHRRFAQGFLLEAADIVWLCNHTIAPAKRRDWRFAPSLADPRGTAPALVVLAECDPLVDEGAAYAQQLRGAGVATTVLTVPGVTHDFVKLGRVLRAEAGSALDAAARALRDCAGAAPEGRA